MTISESELFLCGPQAPLPPLQKLHDLRQLLLGQKTLCNSLAASLKELPDLLKKLIAFDSTLNIAQAFTTSNYLWQWLESGQLSVPLDSLSNVTTLPFTVLLQIALFVQHMTRADPKLDYSHTVQTLQHYGAQGFCTGFLTAAAIDFAADLEQLARYTAVSIRLAMCIGAYVDQNTSHDESVEPARAVSVRWRQEQISKSHIVALLEGFDHAYISSVTDINSVTITLQAKDEQRLLNSLKDLGFGVKKVNITGRFHSAVDHYKASQSLKAFSHQVKGLRYPKVSSLQAPLRSNVDGNVITCDDLVTDIAIESILLYEADWFTTVHKTLNCRTPDSGKIVTFAFSDGVLPLSLSHNGQFSNGMKHVGAVNVDAVNDRSDMNHMNGVQNNRIKRDALEDEYPPHSIAIVGMACRFPGSDNVNQFWELLESGLSVAREVPSERLTLHSSRLSSHKNTNFWGNFIDDPDTFDHRFFKKSAREAVSWDPEKRILLEVVYQALESAGHFRPTIAEKVPCDYGCYIGAVANNYYDNVACHPPNAYSMLGTSRAFFSGRISHQFGFTGPAMTIDTACSSSLVAINAACRAIQSGECSRAIAGGTNIFSSPFDYQNLAAAGFLSPTGACKPFDASADGYCRGEGVAAVVLKPLFAAIDEGDHILGVIVGSAVNQNHNDAHITVPCTSSQTSVFKKVLDMAKVSSSSVTYVEAHGTGTQVGDPIECQSIRDAFGGPHRRDILNFGSVKGHIGHTEASAGVAGLIKVLLMMHHSTIVGQANFNKLNPKISPLEPDMIAISKESQQWCAAEKLACINSYGAAGSNAVIAVRDFRSNPAEPLERQPCMAKKLPFFLAASSENSCVEYARILSKYINEQRASPAKSELLLSNVLFNLADRSNHDLTYRIAKTVANLDDLEKVLTGIYEGVEAPIKAVDQTVHPVIMVFGGQEHDFIGLRKDIVESSALLQYHLDMCDQELRSLSKKSIFPAIYERHSIQHLPTLHAVLFAAQYASAMAWIDSGMKVHSIVGHSFGQLTALCVSGSLSLGDAMRLIIGRAELIQDCWGTEERGIMVSLQSDHATVMDIVDAVNANILHQKLAIACYNHPTNYVVVGTTHAVASLEKHIVTDHKLQQSVRFKRLKITHGFHSALCDNILPVIDRLASTLAWRKPTITIELATEQHIVREPGAWLISNHMRNPVFFSSAVNRLEIKHGSCVWVEAGQGSSVMSLVKQCVNSRRGHLFCPSMLSGPSALSSMAETVVDLWKSGIHVQFWPYHRRDRRRYQYMSLPPYQFEKTRHWLPFIDQPRSEPPKTAAAARPVEIIHEFISFLDFTDSKREQALFLVDPESKRYTYLLNGHLAHNQALAPASLYVELLSRAAIMLTDGADFSTHVLNMSSMRMIGAPIGLDSKRNIYIQLTRNTSGRDSWDFEFFSRLKQGSEDAQVHVTGIVGLGRRDDPELANTIMQWSALIGFKRCLAIMKSEEGEKMQGKHIYQALQRLILFHEMYHGIKSISYEGHEAAGKVAATLDSKLDPSEALYDTPTIDGMMQFAGVLVNWFAHPSGKDVLLCQGINRVVTSGAFDITAREWIAYSLLTEDTSERTVSDVYIFDRKSQKVVIAFIGFVFTRTSVSVLQRSLRSVNSGGAGSNPTSKSPGVAASPCLKSSVSVSTTPLVASATEAFAKSSKSQKVLEVLYNVTDIPIDEITPDSTLENLGIDSLLVTEVLNEIQRAFGLEIDLNTFLFFPNVKAVCNHVDSALGITAVTSDAPAIPLPRSSGTSDVNDTGTSHTTSVELRPDLRHAQAIFSTCKNAYQRAAVEVEAVGFWEKCYPRQAALVLAYVVEAFAKLGCDLNILEAGLAAPKISSLPNHEKLVRQLYRVLEDAELLIADVDGQFFRTKKDLDPVSASTLYKQIIPDFPLHASVHIIVQAVGSVLAECLTGERDGLQVVFGDKDNKKTLDDLYENWPLVRAGTVALGEYLGKLMKDQNQSGVFRILEVGAGTGGTTKYIVRYLQKLGIPFEYVFTDISPSLVAAAKRTFKDYPEMEFTTLDIEKEPPSEWRSSYHVIISTNCVHATRNLTTSLTSLRKLLRHDGILTLVEITKNMFWLDIAVGLFEGWWLFEDGRVHAVADVEIWKEHMLRAGFEAVEWTDGKTEEAKTIRVIVGFASGEST